MAQKSQSTAIAPTTLKGARVLVIGLGISGQSAASFLLKREAEVVGLDSNPMLDSTHEKISGLCRRGMSFVRGESIEDINQFDLVVVSPGISRSHPLYLKALEQGIEVIGEVELACREITTKCVAVTGTNGKTTVTLLTAHILEKAGIKAKALGNVGVPLTSAVDALGNDKADVFVIELSSFQLETLTKRFIDAAVILNITPDHLDRYPSMEEYAAAKIGVEKNLKENGRLFVEDKCSKDFGRLFNEGQYAIYGYDPQNHLYTDTQSIYHEGKQVLKISELLDFSSSNAAQPSGKLHMPGSGRSHDLENIMASYALCSSLSISPQDFLIGFASFQKPSHRIEFVKTVNGVHYYDDSKGTNIDAVIRAVEVLKGDIILIAGGVDKGFPYTPWIDAFGGKVKAICAIGQSKEKMKNDLEIAIPVMLFPDLEQAVVFAASMAKTGDNILLSPGCSSFDMFKDYVHRGLEFQRIVNGL